MSAGENILRWERWPGSNDNSLRGGWPEPWKRRERINPDQSRTEGVSPAMKEDEQTD